MSKQKKPCGFVEFYSSPNIMSKLDQHDRCRTTIVLPIYYLKDSLAFTKVVGMVTIAVLKIYLKPKP